MTSLAADKDWHCARQRLICFKHWTESWVGGRARERRRLLCCPVCPWGAETSARVCLKSVLLKSLDFCCLRHEEEAKKIKFLLLTAYQLSNELLLLSTSTSVTLSLSRCSLNLHACNSQWKQLEYPWLSLEYLLKLTICTYLFKSDLFRTYLKLEESLPLHRNAREGKSISNRFDSIRLTSYLPRSWQCRCDPDPVYWIHNVRIMLDLLLELLLLELLL